MKPSLEQIYVFVDDFIQENELNFTFQRRARLGRMTLSELITLRIFFQMSQVKTLKAFYFLLKNMDSAAFPGLVSYARWILWQPRIEPALHELMMSVLASADELNALDSTALNLLHFNRKGKVMSFQANCGHKTAKKWFYGFKLHVLVNSKAQLVEVRLTPANTHDLTPIKDGMLWLCEGIVTADSAYISKDLKEDFLAKGCLLLALPRENQEKQFTPEEKTVYRFRTTIERVFSQLKLYYNLLGWNPRSTKGFFANVYAALTAYALNRQMTA